MSLQLIKPRLSWLNDQYLVDWAGVPIGTVGLIGDRWFAVAEDSSVELQMHFATAEEAAQYMVDVVVGGKPQCNLRLVVNNS